LFETEAGEVCRHRCYLMFIQGMTEEQKKDAERLARCINREQLVSVMNDTKWQRLFNALQPMECWLDFRRKDVRESDAASESWHTDLYHMMGGWRSIEWLDIRARETIWPGFLIKPKIVDKTATLIEAIKGAGVPFSRHENYIRIWGYVRPGVSPQWER